MAAKSTIVLLIIVFSILGLLLGLAQTLQDDDIAIHVLKLETDKQEYRVGEKVTFTATNTGSARLLFASGSMQLHLENLDTNTRYRVISGQVFNSLEPGHSKTLIWNENRDGELEPGHYVARIQTSPAGGIYVRVQAFFSIAP